MASIIRRPNSAAHNERSLGAGLRLFCFPYAGGSSSVYRSWQGHVSPMIKVHAIELPGRGARFSDPPIRSINGIVQLCLSELHEHFHGRFAFFGYSMGGIIAFELARELAWRHGNQPANLTLAACKPPRLLDGSKKVFRLPDEQFLAELRRLGGTPVELFENPELLDLMAPTLRADFEALETYNYRVGPLLTCPIVTIGGTDDREVPIQELNAWAEETTNTCWIEAVPGHHFLLHTREIDVIDITLRHLA